MLGSKKQRVVYAKLKDFIAFINPAIPTKGTITEG
jgi:hypothetical protein